MGCSSCGQRYIKRGSPPTMGGARYRPPPIRRYAMPPVAPKGLEPVVVSDPRTAATDPSTGQAIETIKSGTIPGPILSNPTQEAVTFKETPGEEATDSANDKD